MTQNAGASAKCEFCDKRGLPLLLVRDAIVPSNSGAPVSSDKPFGLPEHAAQFTRRILRNGFVNVYDEARKRWEAYYVTGDGYFFKMMLTPGITPVKPMKPFNCPDQGHRAVASCITVPDPTRATKVWIGFSDVIWTPAVRARNENKAYRAKHMVAVDVAAALAGSQQPHCRPITQVSATVAEYALRGKKATAAFSWNTLHQFYAREDMAPRLQAECDALRRGKALMVTVPDPVGIASELAVLMKRNVDFFNRDPLRQRLLAADTAIAGVEGGVRDNAILRAVEDGQDSAKVYDRMVVYSDADRRRMQTYKEAALDVTDAERKAAGDKAWEPYAKKFNDKERKKWKAQYERNLALYSRKWVDPLASAHVDVMKSAKLSDYFESNYDDLNIDSGAVYVSTVSKCAIGTQDKPACARLYADWIEGEFTDKKNLLLRAMMLNQKKLTEQIAEVTKVKVDPRAIPWDNLIGSYAEATKKIAAGGSDVVASFLTVFGGPIAGLLGRWVVDGKYGMRGAIMAIGMIAKHPVVRIEVTDKRIAFRRLLAKQLVTRSGMNIDIKKLHQAIGAELALQGVNGQKMQGNIRTTWIIFVDDTIPGINPAASEAEKIAHVLKYLRTAQAVDNLNLSRFRTVINSDVRFGVLGMIAQCVAWTKLIEDERKALPDSKSEARWKLMAGSLAIVATASEVVANGYKGAGLLRMGASYASAGLDKLVIVSKALGIFGALVVAWFDANSAVGAYKEKQYGMTALYGGAAVGGVSLAVFIAFPALLGAAAVPVIGLLFVAVVAIAIAIEFFKDNPVQDWLERCYWGIYPNERYPSQKAEQAAYQNALKG